MKIYMASKAHHRTTWRGWRDKHSLSIISRWIDTPDKYTSDPTGLDYKALWHKCHEDVEACDALICVVHRGEVLKGAILEVGIALALYKQIFLVGDRDWYLANGSWINHDYVSPVGSMTDNELFQFVKAISMAKSPHG